MNIEQKQVLLQCRHLLGNDIDIIPEEQLLFRIDVLQKIANDVHCDITQLTQGLVETRVYITSECSKKVVETIRKNKNESIDTIKATAKEELRWEIDYYKDSPFWQSETSLDKQHYIMMLDAIEEYVIERYIANLTK